MEPIRVSCFTDILCVWAYIAQVRLDELEHHFPQEVVLEHHFVPIFGNPRERLEARWKDRGGLGAYSEHVRGVAAKYPHVTVHPDVWVGCVPHSSLSAHLFLCALRHCERAGVSCTADGSPAFESMIWALRRAFFAELADISDRSVQFTIAERLGIPAGPIEQAIASGEAFAEMGRDLELVRDQSVTVSPTLIFNEGRQRLNGNVGYRVIEANIRELLHTPPGELSWC
ncbi:MAG: disulfide bond formation protein DsbA [Betaproteobacteria bacterium]|nr:disulfide bond formation protein DsbA [Betaproteobacteria bacterium]